MPLAVHHIYMWLHLCGSSMLYLRWDLFIFDLEGIPTTEDRFLNIGVLKPANQLLVKPHATRTALDETFRVRYRKKYDQDGVGGEMVEILVVDTGGCCSRTHVLSKKSNIFRALEIKTYKKGEQKNFMNPYYVAKT